jgi:hypothetical protein
MMNTHSCIVVIAMVLLAAIIGCAGCTSSQRSSSAGVSLSSYDPGDTCPITDYGNGVAFFGCKEGAFASELSRYIEKNDVIITSIADVPSISAYNGNAGYIVVSRPANASEAYP